MRESSTSAESEPHHSPGSQRRQPRYSFKAPPNASLVLFFCDRPRRATIRANSSVSLEVRTSAGVKRLLVATGAVAVVECNAVMVSSSHLGGSGEFWFADSD